MPSAVRPVLAVVLAVLLATALHAAPAGTQPTFMAQRGMVRSIGPRGMELATMTDRVRMRFPRGQEGDVVVVHSAPVSAAALKPGIPVAVAAGADGTAQSVIWLSAAPTPLLANFFQAAGAVTGTLSSLKGSALSIKQGGTQERRFKISASTQYLRDNPSSQSSITPQARAFVGWEQYEAGSLVRFVRLLP